VDLTKVHKEKMKFTRNTDNNILDCHPSHSLDVEYEQNFKLLQATSVRNCPCKHDISSPAKKQFLVLTRISLHTHLQEILCILNLVR